MQQTDTFAQEMFQKGYVKLPLGSYRMWIHKKWHDFFLHKRLVTQNDYGQFVCYYRTAPQFSDWLDLYDKLLAAKNYGGENLSPGEALIVKEENLFL